MIRRTGIDLCGGIGIRGGMFNALRVVFTIISFLKVVYLEAG